MVLEVYMKDNRRMLRQGDIMLVPVTSIPSAAKASTKDAENGRYILARGEVTGHHHSVAISDRVAMFREDGSGGGLFMTVTGAPALLEHQEHSTLTLDAGNWRVLRQRTALSTGAARYVAD